MQTATVLPAKPRACEACRALKIRCLPSKEEGTCQKCWKLGKECHVKPPATRASIARGKNSSRTRVAEMEKKLDGLVALLTKPDAERSPKKTASPVMDLPGQGPAPTGEGPPQPSLKEPAARPNPREDYFYQLFENDVEADNLVDIYRNLGSNFPFIVVPPQATVFNLRRDRPMLLLSILTSASVKNRARQVKLEEELRSVLSEKIVIRAEKSLDLLQAILLHMAWYIFHYKPHTQIITMLTHLAIGLISELGYDKPPQKPPHQFSLDIDRPSLQETWNGQHHLDMARGPKNTLQSWNFDIQRAVLGCWCLSSAFAISFRKQNNMRFTPYLERCCTSLAQNPEVPSDQHLIHIIRGQCLAEDVNLTFGYLEPWALGPVQLEMNLRSFQTRFNAIKKDVEDTFMNETPAHLVLGLANLSAYIHEAGLHLPLTDGKEKNAISEATRVIILTACLEATKDFFEKVIALSLEDFGRLNILDYLRVTYAIVVLSKLSLGQPNPPQNAVDTWDTAYVQTNVPLEGYLQALFNRAQALHTPQPAPTLPNTPREHDGFFYFSGTITSMKLWYERMVYRRERIEPSPLEVMHDHTHDENAMRKVAQSILENGREAMQMPPEAEVDDFLQRGWNAYDYGADDFWASMLSDWPSFLDGSGPPMNRGFSVK